MQGWNGYKPPAVLLDVEEWEEGQTEIDVKTWEQQIAIHYAQTFHDHFQCSPILLIVWDKDHLVYRDSIA